jgi:FkbM family methyltransferase
MNFKEGCYLILDKVLLGKGIKRTINGIQIVFPTRYYRYYEANYESKSFEFIKSQVKPGDVVFDIGGHIGLHAVTFAKLVKPKGKVYSFEPTPSTNALLQKTVELNKVEDIVSVQNEAISKNKGETVFYISDDLTDNSNSLVQYEKPKKVNGIRVPTITIDEFRHQKGKVNFIKIDIEGAELDALKGARQTMMNDKPLCILSLHPFQIQSKGDTLKEIWDIIESFNYSVYFDGRQMRKGEFCDSQELFDVQLTPNS